MSIREVRLHWRVRNGANMESLVQARGKEMLPLRDTREEGLMIVCVIFGSLRIVDEMTFNFSYEIQHVSRFE